MEFTVSEAVGPRFLEGVKQSCMRNADDAAEILQECLSRRVDRVMLYSENVPDRFFDLSSGEAGAILQKCRNYNIRLAVVCSIECATQSEVRGDGRGGAPWTELWTLRDTRFSAPVAVS